MMYRVFCGNARIDEIGFEKWNPPSPSPMVVAVPATSGMASTPALAVPGKYGGPPCDLCAEILLRFSLGLSTLQSPIVLRRTVAVLKTDSANSVSDRATCMEREGRQGGDRFQNSVTHSDPTRESYY
jgi:hypothetical protein